MTRRTYIAFVLCLALSFSACAKKAATPNQPPSDPFSSAVRACDDIALAIRLLNETERNLQQQKIITAHEGLLVNDGLSAVQQADVQFQSDIVTARKTGDRSALAPALKALRQAVSNLNDKGVLGIKSADARAAFQTSLNTVNLAIATLEAFTR